MGLKQLTSVIMGGKTKLHEFKEKAEEISAYSKRLDELLSKRIADEREKLKVLNSKVSDVSLKLFDAEVEGDEKKVAALKMSETKVLEEISLTQQKINTIKDDVFSNGVMLNKFESLLPVAAEASNEIRQAKQAVKNRQIEIKEEIAKLKKESQILNGVVCENNVVIDKMVFYSQKIYPEFKEVRFGASTYSKAEKYIKEKFHNILGL